MLAPLVGLVESGLPPPFPRPWRFLLVGAAGGHNLGDEALLRRNMDMLQEAFPSCTFVLQTRHPERTRKTFSGYSIEAVRAADLRFSTPALIQKALECQAVISCGGVFFAHSVFRLRFGFAGSLPPLLAACRWAGIPIVALNVGVQLPRTRLGRAQLRLVLNQHDHLFLRDPQDVEVLAGLGVSAPHTVSADSALVPGSADSGRALAALQWTERPSRLIGWNLSHHMQVPPHAPGAPRKREALARHLGRAIRLAADQLGAHVLLVATVREDHQFLREVAPEIGIVHRVTVAPFADPETTRQFMGLCDLFVGTRLHSLIFAAVQGVPCMALPYRPKSAQFIGLAGLPARWALTGWWIGPKELAEPVVAAYADRSGAREVLRRFVAECEPKTRWGVQWLTERLGTSDRAEG